MPPGRRNNPSKRPCRVEGDGTPLADETLLSIFAGLTELADLVRCAATCTRWRRMVSNDAAFLCRRRRLATGNRSGRFLTALSIGFFHCHQQDDDDDGYAAAPRFIATASASRSFGLRQPTPLKSLVADVDGLLGAGPSRVVASRNSLVVVDSRRDERDRDLKLCVCNPLTGHAHALPPLAGKKDGLGQYACTVITAHDLDTESAGAPPSSYFRVVIVYRRRGFTAFRSYSSSEDGGGSGEWSEEAKVSGARLVGREKMSSMRNSVVARGGRAVYWLFKDVVFGLRLDTLEAATADLPSWPELDTENVLLGLTPSGRLCAVRLDVQRRIKPDTGGKLEYTLRIRSGCCGRGGNVVDGDDHGDDIKLQMGRLARETRDVIWVGKFLLDNIVDMKLMSFCERSGVVFFSACEWSYSSDRRYYMYRFCMDARTVEKVASHVGWRDPWRDVHGYEMDQPAYLASLAPGDEGGGIHDVDHPLSASAMLS